MDDFFPNSMGSSDAEPEPSPEQALVPQYLVDSIEAGMPTKQADELAALSILRARYLDPATSGHERERRIRPLIAKYITADAYGIEEYSWPAGLDMRGIPDPGHHQQTQLFGRGIHRPHEMLI